MTPWLSVVIPTIGRDTLAVTLESLAAQPEYEGVEVLVVGDTHGGWTTALYDAETLTVAAHQTFLAHDGGRHCFGQPQRTAGARAARAPWVAFTQDDNIAAKDSLAYIEMAIDDQPHQRPIFFRWLAPWREVIWRIPQLRPGNIDADCLVFPRHIAQEVVWGMHYEGDYDAARQAYQLSGMEVSWCEEIISIARPDAEHLWWKA